jgi:hypothetical protein
MKTSENASPLSCWRYFVGWVRRLYRGKEDKIDFPISSLQVLEVQMLDSNSNKRNVPTFPDTGCDISCISLNIVKKMGYSKSDIRPLRIRAELVSKLKKTFFFVIGGGAK